MTALGIVIRVAYAACGLVTVYWWGRAVRDLSGERAEWSIGLVVTRTTVVLVWPPIVVLAGLIWLLARWDERRQSR